MSQNKTTPRWPAWAEQLIDQYGWYGTATTCVFLPMPVFNYLCDRLDHERQGDHHGQ